MEGLSQEGFIGLIGGGAIAGRVHGWEELSEEFERSVHFCHQIGIQAARAWHGDIMKAGIHFELYGVHPPPLHEVISA